MSSLLGDICENNLRFASLLARYFIYKREGDA